MHQYQVQIEGMSCSMCESHINETIRKNFNVKKVTSSHTKNECQIVTEEKISLEALKKVIDPTGYQVLGMEEIPYEKKGLFGFLHK
jgi:copper chaperone CopZ